MTSTSTRELVLDYLSHYSTASAVELSNAMQVTKPAIQYHLKKLIEDGLLERIPVTGNIKSTVRGRPTIYYRLSRVSQPDNLKRLLNASLSMLQQMHEQDKENDFLQELVQHLFAEIGKEKSLPMRLKRTVEELNQYAYQASWEAHNKGPIIRLKNCPYKSVWYEHPELCEMDRLAMERITRLEARQIACIHQVEPDSPVCLFQLHGE